MNARTHMASRLGLAAVLAVSLARGQSLSSSGSGGGHLMGETPPEAAARAREHFQKGRELYQAGAYREAIGELEAARSLDPRAKDLVFNLAVVNEKLGQIDPAIHYVHVYSEMDLDPQERARADAYMKRLEGAKKEAEARAAAAAARSAETASTVTPAASQEHGRLDAATVTAAVLAVGGVAFGTTFGVKALADRPTNFVTGKDGPYSTYLSDQQHAHTEAILADVGFGVGVAAAAIAAYLYFGRTKENTPPRTETTTVSAAPVMDGGHGAVLVVLGSF